MGNKQTSDQKSINQYIKYLKQRKQESNLNGLKFMKYEQIIYTITSWKDLAKELLQIQSVSNIYNDKVKKIIKELIIFVDNINSEEFIRVYQNKYALEELIRQDISEHTGSVIQQNQIKIDHCQKQIETLMKQTRIKRNLLNNFSETKQQSKFKTLIEKEILQKDHFIMVIVEKYCTLICKNLKLKEINDENQEIVDHQQSLRFITKFQMKMFQNIYNNQYIDQDIAIKTIFSFEKLYFHYYQLLQKIYKDELMSYEKQLIIKESTTLSELGADQIYWMEDKKDKYKEVVNQLNSIHQIKCPVKKFELIGNLKHTICKCLDQYYKEKIHIQRRQIQVDSDHFLIILIFALIQQNEPEFMISLKLIQFTMSKEIEIDRGQNSWVFVSLLAAMTHIKNESKSKDNIQNCLETVIQSNFYTD